MIFILTLIIVLLLQVGSPWAFVLLLLAALAEVAELLFLRRWAKHLRRRYKPVDPDEALVGLVAEVVTPCRPNGQVRIRGEIWEATCAIGAGEGASVRVERVESLTLFVVPQAE
jgi:membrane protein implicated in regulation of membrane protease activity